MSGASPHLSPKSQSPKPEVGSAAGARPQRDPVLARLLHALNQPLTGLQCSLELALATPREPVQYASAIREALDLTERMRELVDATREVIEIRASAIGANQLVDFGDLLAEVIDELRPVAESRKVRIAVECVSASPVACERGFLLGLLFRFVESTLSLTRQEGQLRIACKEHSGHTRLAVDWDEGLRNQKLEFSHSELGLLLAQTGCEQIGGRWERGSRGTRNFCAMWLPRPAASLPGDEAEDLR